MVAGILCDMSKRAYGGRVGRDNQAILAAFYVRFFGRVWERYMSQAREEGDISVKLGLCLLFLSILGGSRNDILDCGRAMKASIELSWKYREASIRKVTKLLDRGARNTGFL